MPLQPGSLTGPFQRCIIPIRQWCLSVRAGFPPRAPAHGLARRVFDLSHVQSPAPKNRSGPWARLRARTAPRVQCGGPSRRQHPLCQRKGHAVVVPPAGAANRSQATDQDRGRRLGARGQDWLRLACEGPFFTVGTAVLNGSSRCLKRGCRWRAGRIAQSPLLSADNEMSSCGSFGRAYLWSRVKIRPVRGWYPSAPGEGKFTEKHAKFRDCARQPVHQVERFLSEWFGEWPGNTKIRWPTCWSFPKPSAA